MNNGWQRKKVSEIAQHSLGARQAEEQERPQPLLRKVNVRWFDFDLSDPLEMRFLSEETVVSLQDRGGYFQGCTYD